MFADRPDPAQQHPWIPIGPSVMTNGQADRSPNVAGRIRDLQVSADGRRAYAASASGGLWYTNDTGNSWRPLDDWQQSPDRENLTSVATAMAGGSLYVEWQTEATDRVWVGTGEVADAWLGQGNLGGPDLDPLPGGKVGGIGFLRAVGPAGASPLWHIESGAPAGDTTHTLRGHGIGRLVAVEGQTLLAATTAGLWVGTIAAGDGDTVWQPGVGIPTTGPDGVTAVVATDVAVTRNGTGYRIWAAGFSALAVTNVASATFTQADLDFHAVPLPNVHYVPDPNRPPRTRLALAVSADGTSVYVLGRRAVDHHAGVDYPHAQLWRVSATSTTLATAAAPIAGLPADLFGPDAASDQSYYDMAIAARPVDPTAPSAPTPPDVLFVGGSYYDRTLNAGTPNAQHEYDGGVHRGTVTGTTIACEWIGRTVHADDHVIRFANNGADVWVGCDGGVFRSGQHGDEGTFAAVNDGLAVLEPGYVASHPTNPGLVAAGFQDNGTAVRVGDTVWQQTFAGDGGGIVFLPNDPADAYIRQYIQASWEGAHIRLTPPVVKVNGDTAGAENANSSFYSGADAAGDHDVNLDTNHLALGTNRVWYSPDNGTSWVTVPSGSDPNAGTNRNLTQDVITARPSGTTDCCADPPPTGTETPKVLTVKFARPGNTSSDSVLRIVALTQTQLAWFEGRRALTSAAPYHWQRMDVPHQAGAIRAPRDATETAAVTAGQAVQFLPTPQLVSDLAVHNPAAGALGSCYVTTVGDSRWVPGATRNPYAVDTLWFFDGSGSWYPTGLRLPPTGQPATAAHWAAPALAVIVDPEFPDHVYVGTAVGVMRGTLTTGGAVPYQWTWEAMNNGLPEAAVQDLSIHWFPRSGTAAPEYRPTAPPAMPIPETPVKLLRAALQARGVWEVDLLDPTPAPRTYLRVFALDTRRRLPTVLTGKTVRGVDTPRWDASPDIVVDTASTVTANATEAQLLAMTRPPRGTTGSVRLSGVPVIHVLVHHRSARTAADDTPAAQRPARVRVALLSHESGASTDGDYAALWTYLAAAASGPPPAGAPPNGWQPAGTNLWQDVADPAGLGLRTPRSVAFSVDLSHADVTKTYVLLAVIWSTADPLSATEVTGATSLDQVVLRSPHAAARTFEVIP